MLMVRTASSPGGSHSGSVAAWSAPAAAAAVATAVAGPLVPTAATGPVVWCGAVATGVIALLSAVAARRGQALAETQARAAERESQLLQHLRLQEAATIRLAEQQLPVAVSRLQEGEFA